MNFDNFCDDIVIISKECHYSKWNWSNVLIWTPKNLVIDRAHSMRPMTFNDFMKWRSDLIFKAWSLNS